jgi:Tfp pilus assembly protein PilO
VTLKKALPVVALLAAAAAFWFLLLAPKREEAAELGTQIAEAEAQVQAVEATAASYEAARRSYKTNYSRLTSLGKAVPADDDTRSLLVQLDTTAAKSDVEFQTLDAGNQSGTTSSADTAGATSAVTPPGTVPFGSAGMAALPLSFTLTGKFEDLSSLLGRLERFVSVRGQKIDVRGRLLRIEGLSLAPGSDGFPSLRAQVSATAYLMPAAKDASDSAGDPAAAPTPSTEDPSAAPAAAITAPTGAAR